MKIFIKAKIIIIFSYIITFGITFYFTDSIFSQSKKKLENLYYKKAIYNKNEFESDDDTEEYSSKLNNKNQLILKNKESVVKEEEDEIEKELDQFFKNLNNKKEKQNLNNTFKLYNKNPNSASNNNSKSSSKNIIEGAKIHQVNEGETLWGISKKYNISPQDLLDSNSKLKSRPLYVNDAIVIPTQKNNLSKSKGIIKNNNSNSNANELNKKNNLSKSNNTKPNNNFHIVGDGDTIYNISKKNNIDMEELKKINNLKDNKINLGQKIILTYTKEKDNTKLHTDKNLNQDEHEDKNEVEQNLSELQNDISENPEQNHNSTTNQTESAKENQNDKDNDNETNNEQFSKNKEGIYLKRDLDPNKKESKEKFFFSWPLQGRITSGYGKRHDPRRKYKIAFHKGIDIANTEGSPFIASKEGVVIRSKKWVDMEIVFLFYIKKIILQFMPIIN